MLMLLSTKLKVRQAIAVVAGTNNPSHLGGVLGPCWLIFRIFSHFFRICWPSSVIMTFFIDFFRIFIDFGRILGVSWEDCSKIFWIFLENAEFVKYSVFHWKNQ